jgi:hypothetical protein
VRPIRIESKNWVAKLTPDFFPDLRPYREKVTRKTKLNEPQLFASKLPDKVGLQVWKATLQQKVACVWVLVIVKRIILTCFLTFWHQRKRHSSLFTIAYDTRANNSFVPLFLHHCCWDAVDVWSERWNNCCMTM